MFKKIAIIFTLILSMFATTSFALTKEQKQVQIIWASVVKSISILERNPNANFLHFEKLVFESFDVDRIVRSAVGPDWRNMSERQREEMTDVLTKHVFTKYIKMIKKFDLTTDQANEVYRDLQFSYRHKGKYTYIYTTIKDYNVTVKLITNTNKIVDISVEIFSLVGSARSDVQTAIDHHNVDGAIKSLARRNK